MGRAGWGREPGTVLRAGPTDPLGLVISQGLEQERQAPLNQSPEQAGVLHVSPAPKALLGLTVTGPGPVPRREVGTGTKGKTGSGEKKDPASPSGL